MQFNHRPDQDEDQRGPGDRLLFISIRSTSSDSRVTVRQNFFAILVVQLWNKLSEEVVSASSVKCFYGASKFTKLKIRVKIVLL